MVSLVYYLKRNERCPLVILVVTADAIAIAVAARSILTVMYVKKRTYSNIYIYIYMSSYEHSLTKHRVVGTGSPAGHIDRGPVAIRAVRSTLQGL